MRRALLPIAVAIALITPAQAQLAPGVSGFSSAPTSASEAEYWTMIRRLGVCLADAKNKESVAFITAAPGSAEEDKAFTALFHRHSNRCMGNFVSASMLRSHVRGSVAEGLLNLMDEDRVRNPAFSADHAPENVRSIHEFAYCYVANNPVTAYQFLDQTQIGTKGEVAAIRQMAVDFGPCFPEGVSIEINPINVRVAIAEAYYRLLTAMPPAQIQGS